MFSEQDLQDVVKETESLTTDRKGNFFATIAKGAMYSHKALRSMALESKMPQVCAELMELDPKTQNLRILRDVFLAKEVTQMAVCGWHVDDQGFWPESYISTASQSSGKDQHGVNAWIALDDMPAKYEGSMAVAAGSHKAEWRSEGYEAIGQDRTIHEYPTDVVVEKLKSGKWNTCDGIENNRPDIKAKLDATSEIVDFKRGDIIFASRLLFHRTMPVTPEGQEFYAKEGKQSLMRYSIRYVPGSAILQNEFTAEWSILDNDKNRGRTLDEVSEDKDNTCCWYPRVWPPDRQDDPDAVAVDDVKIASVKEKEKEVYSLFRMMLTKEEDQT